MTKSSTDYLVSTITAAANKIKLDVEKPSAMLLEFQNGLNVIDSLIHPNSPTNDVMTDYQRDGLRLLYEALLTTLASETDLSDRVDSMNIKDPLVTPARSHIPRNLLLRKSISIKNIDVQNACNIVASTESTNEYLLSQFGGLKSTNNKKSSSKWKVVLKAVNANNVVKQLKKKLSDRELQKKLSARNIFQSENAPIEWYRLDREVQRNLYDNYLSWEKLQKWDFDVFELSKLCDGKPLLFIGWAILSSPQSQQIMEETFEDQQSLSKDTTAGTHFSVLDMKESRGYNFLDKYKISGKVMVDFLRAIEDRYISENAYHNNIHAADVLQTTHSFLEEMGVGEGIPSPDIQIFSVLVGAAIHDVGHPGYNNSFQSNSFSSIALTYNDNSVLENYHISTAFRLILGDDGKDDLNIFKNMDHNDFLKCKRYITEAILDTDMTFHFARYDEIKKIKPIFTSPQDASNINEDTKVDDEEISLYSWKLLKFLMHMADISNLAKRKNVSIQWTNRVLKEFFTQGDREKELGLPVSPLCDRSSTNRADSQMGFIDFIIRPSFVALQNHLPSSKKKDHKFLQYIESNYQYWKNEKSEAFQLGKEAEATARDELEEESDKKRKAPSSKEGVSKKKIPNTLTSVAA